MEGDDKSDSTSEFNEIDGSFSEGVDEDLDFEDLKTYHNQKSEGPEKEFLNASTADFNKAIK